MVSPLAVGLELVDSLDIDNVLEKQKNTILN